MAIRYLSDLLAFSYEFYELLSVSAVYMYSIQRRELDLVT